MTEALHVNAEVMPVPCVDVLRVAVRKGERREHASATLLRKGPWVTPEMWWVAMPPDLAALERAMRLLLIDDDAGLVAVLTLALERAGFAVWSAQSATAALATVDAERPHLIVLAMPLRTGDAMSLLCELRYRCRPAVIMLTGRGNEDERVACLERGATDYVAKPFSTREIVARIRAILQHHDPDPSAAGAVITVGSLVLSPASRAVTHAGELLALSPVEFRLLHYLMRHAGHVVTFAALLRQVWGCDDPSVTDVVRTTVYRLRRKLKDDPAQPHLLHSIPGVGFRLAVSQEDQSLNTSQAGECADAHRTTAHS